MKPNPISSGSGIRHRMTRLAINGPLTIGTGFTKVQEWEFEATCHPFIPAWFGRHFSEGGWAPTQLLAFLAESSLLRSLKVREAIISFEKQTEVWLPESRDQACSVIGKFTQGSKADGKRLTRRLVTNHGELDYLVRDTRLVGTLVGAPMKCELGHILTYYNGLQPLFAHLRVSMLAYAHINLLSMLSRFEPDEAIRAATDSIYVKKTAFCKLEGSGPTSLMRCTQMFGPLFAHLRVTMLATPTSTSSLCSQGLNPMRPSEWQQIPSM